MRIRDRETGQVMYLDEFRRIQKEKFTPGWKDITEENIKDYEVDIIFEGPQAVPTTPYQYSMEDGVEQKHDGNWYVKYILGPIFNDVVVDGKKITAAQQEAEYKARKDAEQSENVRQTRNRMLLDCDWTQVKDVPVAFSDKWKTYRQALRDVTTQTGFPWNVQWPTKPE